MTNTQTQGGFTGDPAAALDVAGASGCCGNPAQATLVLPAPTSASPCCGTAAEATEAGSCCGTSAKAEAVASGAGCCG
ncbi:hypothetical protein [Dactylosporangium sp. NPDC051541]|uniref:hypothetical protein n=1 Tax=Dactylosporangium sp. NPDC051541 TaxID=3363977 RepID=UPI0037AE6671